MPTPDPDSAAQQAASEIDADDTRVSAENSTDADAQDAAPPKIKKRGKIALFVTFAHILGLWTSVHAVMSTRTSQGAIAWAISANTVPYVAVPAYWIFGKSKFDGYELLRHSAEVAESETAQRIEKILVEEKMLYEPQTEEDESHIRLLDAISKLPVTVGNDVDLLVDGEDTFDAIIEGIESAEDYILFQFYILRSDALGNRIKDALVERARAGVDVYVLYDELGSKDLSQQFKDDLRNVGAEIAPFNTTQGGNRFRLNFRNHRKIVVVDGRIAYVGGHNVGVEYLGEDPVLTPWRDTHVAMQGPVVHCVQVPFVEDWHWATGELLDLNWDPELHESGNIAAACIPTGPADVLETGTLWFLHAINNAEKRLWIVSPYFVPDEQLMSALQLAALRGVDVRVLIPQNPDHVAVYLAGVSYLEEAKEAGVKIYRYQPGFLHQKVMLIDDYASAIGTANLDNRSMRLNFEVTMLLLSREFASEVEAMLEEDFSKSELTSAAEYTEQSLPYRFMVRAARLLAPVL